MNPLKLATVYMAVLLFATMAKNRDGGGQPRGMNSKGKTVKLPPLKPAGKPTEAIVAKGQKPKDLGKSTKDNRFASNAKTPVKQSGKGFVGSGGTLASGFKDIKRGDIVNAALAVTSLPGSGQVRAALAKAAGKRAASIGGRVAAAAEESAYVAASKGLGATGAGGKVSRTMTPMGPTLRSTAIGTAKQQAGRMAGLEANAARISTAAASGGAKAAQREIRKAMQSTLKATTTASKVTRASSYAYVKGKAQESKPKLKKKK